MHSKSPQPSPQGHRWPHLCLVEGISFTSSNCAVPQIPRAMASTWVRADLAEGKQISELESIAAFAGSSVATVSADGGGATSQTTVSVQVVGASVANAFYTALNGSDLNSGSITQPLLTIHKGACVLLPGDTLYVRAGTYAEEFANQVPSGSSWTLPVTLSAYPGESVTIRPSAGASRVFTFTQGQFIVLNGLILDGANVVYDPVKITFSPGAANHIRLQNCEVMNAPQQGILVTGDIPFKCSAQVMGFAGNRASRDSNPGNIRQLPRPG